MKTRKPLPEPKGMRVTPRDIAIMEFINECGFCDMTHLSQRFKLTDGRNYKILARLIKAGYVIHERILHEVHGVYRLTRLGALGFSDLPSLKRIPMPIYRHEMTLVQLRLQLSACYPEAEWVSERQLRYLILNVDAKRKVHVPDGVLKFTEKRRIAIELELTVKKQHRFLDILRNYTSNDDYEEVWYVCDEKVVKSIEIQTARYSFIKVKRLLDLLS